ncbi:MAG TPA: DJ-1/PfpI family protein [Prolixibacteraceae bacterium]|nr:DJ-1/PfpI family protein [Prolixibacteraceae bacterium]HPS13135.1 DJ-1/PfpI family protein [Prolixibacteraceae bacterium]
MKKIMVHLATGFEEMEVIIPVDIWKRAGFQVQLVSVTGNKVVTGAHAIPIVADLLFEEADYSNADLLFLPGGMPGASNLDAHKGLQKKILEHNQKGKNLAAICAAPLILGHNNLLKSKRATCYPGYEKDLWGAIVTGNSIEIDGNIVTGKGPGVAFEFAMRITEMFIGRDAAMKLAAAMQVSPSIIP